MHRSTELHVATGQRMWTARRAHMRGGERGLSGVQRWRAEEGMMRMKQSPLLRLAAARFVCGTRDAPARRETKC